MNVVGVRFSNPGGLSLAGAATLGVLAGLTAVLVMLPFTGAGWKHVAAVVACAVGASLISQCGAGRAGGRGFFIVVMVGALIHVVASAVLTAF